MNDVSGLSFQVLQYMRDVSFIMKTGENIFFDASGDPVARYDLVNWQPAEDGSLLFKHVGVYDSSLPLGQRLQVNQEHILWAGKSGEVHQYYNYFMKTSNSFNNSNHDLGNLF